MAAKAKTALTNKPQDETNFRMEIVNSFLKSTHRKLEDVAAFHKATMENDPHFYGKIGAWYFYNGTIRDHKEVLVANLLTSKHSDHREAGFMLLQELNAEQVSRVVTFMVNNLHAGCKFSTINKNGKKSNGWYLPKQAKLAVEVYLRRLENNPRLFDRVAIRNMATLKSLYTGLHLKPNQYANQILFENNPPKESLIFAMKAIAREKDPDKQAQLIVEYKIPYVVAVGIVRQMTPAVIIALISVMTRQELSNNVKSLEKHGAYNDPEVKAFVAKKLKGNKGNVAAMKATKTADNVGDTDIAKALNVAATKSIRKQGQIKEPTALWVDSSTSMEKAIALGIDVAAGMATCVVPGTDFFVYTFDRDAREIKTTGGNDIDAWRKAFANIKLVGQTSIGAPFFSMRKKGQVANRIFIITDEGENASPYFSDEFDKYVAQTGVKPEIYIIRFGHGATIESKLVDKKATVTVIKPDGADGFSVENIVQIACKGSQADLVFDILEVELPKKPRDEFGNVLPIRNMYLSQSELTDATV